MLTQIITAQTQDKFDQRIQYQFEWIRKDAKIIQEYGYKLLGFTHYMGEATFIFESNEEAVECYNHLESQERIIQGWFYEKHEFMKYKNEYEHEYLGDGIELPIEWIDNNNL
jgi:hypothetical protein